MSLLAFEDAFDRLVRGAVAIGETERVPLRQAAGRVLAANLVSLRTQPGFDASAMDGYALRAQDAREPFEPLDIIGESAAGRAFDGFCAERQCVRIFTGAPMPQGADSVLIQENAERLAGGRIKPLATVRSAQNIRRAGADFSAGETLIAARTTITPGRVAMAASCGYPLLDVIRRPRVAVVATGDELVLPGENVGPSQIVASNGFGIAAMVEEAGGVALDYGIASDDMDEIGGRVQRAIDEKVDILVTIGGASVGDHDLVGPVLVSRGVKLDFWKIAMRPGKPLMAGRLGPMRILGLPGNPASSLVTATLFLQPLVRALCGLSAELPMQDGVLGSDMGPNDERADFLRASIGDKRALTPILVLTGRQDSSLLSVFARADALLYRPPHAPAAKAGDSCRFLPLT